MKTVVTIHYLDIAVRNTADAGALIKLLGQAILVERDYEAEGDQFFIKGPVKIRVESFPDSAFKAKPGEAVVESWQNLDRALPLLAKMRLLK